MKWQDFFLKDPYEGAKLVPLDPTAAGLPLRRTCEETHEC
jgi:hypothetical protein